MSTESTSWNAAADRGITAKRHGAFGLFVAASALVLWKVLSGLVSYSWNNESASHVVLIPFVSIFLAYIDRDRIFRVTKTSLLPGAALGLGGVALYVASWRTAGAAGGNVFLALATLALLVIWAGGFLACYGESAAREAAFPLLFLLLMIPLPTAPLEWTIHQLQEGSTDISYFLFKALGVPVFRQGFVLSVPTVSIEVAEECSGIRSSIALFITCLLAAHLFLRSSWNALLFVVLSIPLAIVKNGIRITTLTLLSIYVDPGFLHGSLHRDGGFVFFLLALAMLAPVLLLLQRLEQRRRPVTRVPVTEG